MSLDFSVIIPTYRRPAELKACLLALGRQDFPLDRFEVIVSDDGGGGLESLRDFGAGGFPLCAFVSAPRSGPATARNVGARNARGRFLAFTDDDCEPSPDWLSSLALALGSQPDALVGGRTVNALRRNRCSSASQQLIDFLYVAYSDRSDTRFFTSNNFALSSLMFASLGGFDVAFRLAAGEDRDFCSRWAATGRPLIYSPNALVYHSHSLTVREFWRQHFRYGQGAYELRRRMQETGRVPLRVEPPGFYLRLFSYPFKNAVGGDGERLAVGMLFALAQAANVCGFAREALGRGKNRRGESLSP